MSQTVRQDLFAPLQLGALLLQHRIVLNSPQALWHGAAANVGKAPAQSLEGGLVVYAVADAHCAEDLNLITHGLASATEVNGRRSTIGAAWWWRGSAAAACPPG